MQIMEIKSVVLHHTDKNFTTTQPIGLLLRIFFKVIIIVYVDVFWVTIPSILSDTNSIALVAAVIFDNFKGKLPTIGLPTVGHPVVILLWLASMEYPHGKSWLLVLTLSSQLYIHFMTNRSLWFIPNTNVVLLKFNQCVFASRQIATLQSDCKQILPQKLMISKII